MNIKILDSWLREYLKTNAPPKQIAEHLSRSSVSVERLEKFKNNDWVYDIEVTTNRPELMSIRGIALEAATILPQSGIKATFNSPKIETPKLNIKNSPEMIIKNDPKLVHRVLAVIMEVTLKESTQVVKDRLESTGIRSLNNVIDVTNYIMREVGHPTHVFDYDRLTKHTLLIRESKKGEKIKTLDGKLYTLSGGDIVADDGTGEIVDLLGVMGTANSVVTNDTKRILFFIDSVEPTHIRKTSMEHGIRTEAAVLNEKAINPEYAGEAFAAGIKMFEKVANGKVISKIIEEYPEKPKATTIKLTEEKINAVVGVTIPQKKSVEILKSLGFDVVVKKNILEVTVPPKKSGDDMKIPEDLIEEIARIYGYHNIPGTLPPVANNEYVHIEKNEIYWEDRVKDALKYWGFTEVFTYPMVSKDLITSRPDEAVTIHNPLNEEFVYMRQTLIPSLLQVAINNPDHEIIKIFELANIYELSRNALPKQSMRLAGLVHKPNISFYEVKGVIEQLCDDMGITGLTFKNLNDNRAGAAIFVGKSDMGVIEMIDDKSIDFEIDFAVFLEFVKQKRTFIPPSKYPPIVEDMAIIAPAESLTGDIIATIEKTDQLITGVTLLDKYKETRTFHIVYQSTKKNLTNEDITPIREKIVKTLKDKFHAVLKS
jgi:phenylalanyl-tRNA synthetase beta chain